LKPAQRRLAAIVFTDIVGYSALSQHDEALALRLLDAHNSLVRGALERHGGREVKTIGDAFLVEFPSALEAIKFAVEVQEEFRNLNRNAEVGNRILVRVGVHVGDVVENKGDLFGDAVNIASRIVAAAEPGGICVSEHVRDQVVNKVGYRLEKLPPMRLKNIEMEIDLFRVVLPLETDWTPGPVNTANRIAVLPFTNISPEPADGYFADGLTEELISALSGARELRVIARASTNRYKETPKSARQVGRELGVAHLLEGSVRKVGNRIRITAYIVDTESEEEIWSDSYEKELVDVFSIQSEIASRVAGSLRIKLFPAEKARIETKETESVAAYAAYLKGRSLLREGTEETARQAKEQFELAIHEDENYAKAYSGLADSMMILGDYLFAPIPVAYDEASAAAKKALSLDPRLAEAHVSLGNLLMYDYKFEDAEIEYRNAIAANPSYASAHHWYSTCLLTLGRRSEGLQEVLQAEQLDPLSLPITLSVIYRLLGSGRDEEIETRIARLEAFNPESPIIDEAKMVLHYSRKEWTAALEYLGRMKERDPTDPYLDMDSAYICAVTGRRDEALSLAEKLKQVPEGVRVKGQLLAFVYVGLGDLESAFEWLRYAVANKEFFISWLRGYPLFEPVRVDPRYRELLAMAGLPTTT
jgi:TolB-like protein/Flp pilus assembly protein TadD